MDVSINWCYVLQDTGKTYSRISNVRSYLKYSKATICRHMKKNIGDLVVTKEQQRKTTKEKYLTTNQCLQEEMRNFFVKKIVMVITSILPFISEETVHRHLQKTELLRTHVQRKRVMSKNDLKLKLKFAPKFYRKPITSNYI